MDRFRKKHLFSLLQSYEPDEVPIDFHVSSYFRKHKALGSKDRAFIAEAVYQFIRWQAIVEYFLLKGASLEEKLEWFSRHDPRDFIHEEVIPQHIRVSFPKNLFTKMCDSWGIDAAIRLALVSNEQAPSCIRVNLLQTDRKTLAKKLLDQGLEVTESKECPTALYFKKKCNFFQLAEFQLGLFEVQDEASQEVAHMVEATPGQKVLDFCAGAGGKALAIAPKLEKSGQLFLHDIRAHALLQAKKRLKRAGVQNAQNIVATEGKKLKRLENNMDWVLVDAPCSGTGTLRRNPDMKWKFSLEMLSRLETQQRDIFAKAYRYVKPGGAIVYATCSILQEENQKQLEYFLDNFSLKQEGPVFSSVPDYGKKDGFFAVRFRKI